MEIPRILWSELKRGRNASHYLIQNCSVAMVPHSLVHFELRGMLLCRVIAFELNKSSLFLPLVVAVAVPSFSACHHHFLTSNNFVSKIFHHRGEFGVQVVVVYLLINQMWQRANGAFLFSSLDSFFPVGPFFKAHSKVSLLSSPNSCSPGPGRELDHASRQSASMCIINRNPNYGCSLLVRTNRW